MRPRYRIALLAEIDDVCNTLATAITALLAPYQPNLPPNYPNSAPTAGTIVATLVAPGQPLLLNVTTQLENGNAQVAVYPGLHGRPEDDIRRDDPASTTSNSVTYEVAREVLDIIVEVWGPTREKAHVIASFVRQFMGDVYKQSEADGTVSKFTYAGYRDDETEQAHSIFIRQLRFSADYTTTQTFTGAEMTTPQFNESIVASISPYSPTAAQL